jgi:putative pyruvate formate lyase activating enzyme
MTHPSYVKLHISGELAQRIDAAWGLFAPCHLCPNRCGARRAQGELGTCGMGHLPKVSSWNLHPWEEPPISGWRGSGTIFFSGCTGRCVFCQNYPISQLGHGQEATVARLAGIMLELQRKGAHNINLVTPTHFVPQILAALPQAIHAGLRLPLVYNTSGYERVEVLELMEGIIDVWLPDAKYADSVVGRRLSGWNDYVRWNHAALREIHRQVGTELALDNRGLARRGMIVRHMVLPGGLAGTARVLRWLAQELAPEIHVSLMDQYFPAHHTLDHPILGRKLTPAEYEAALQALNDAGLRNGWVQESVC